MKKFTTLLVSILMVVTFALGLVACGGGSKFVLDKSELELFVEDTYTLTATYDGAKPSGTVGWLSSDKSVATVSNDGVVTALKVGEATITAEFTSGTSVNRATCKVKVTEDTSKLASYKKQEYGSESDPSRVTSQTVLKFYNTGKVKVDLMHQGYEGQFELNYTASGSSVTASQAAGEFITLNANDYAIEKIIPFMAFLGVEMGENVWVSDFTIGIAADYITVKGKLYLTEDAKNAGVGEVTTFATFTMTAAEATKLGITLADRVEVESLTAEDLYGDDDAKQNISIPVGDKRFIKIVVSPENATIGTYTIASENSKVATLGNDGVLEAIGVGTTKITITSDSDATKKAELNVTVTAIHEGAKAVKGYAHALGYTKAVFKDNGKVTLEGVYFPYMYGPVETDYTITDGKIVFTDATAIAMNIFKMLDPNAADDEKMVMFSVKFTVVSTDGYDFVTVTVKETLNPDAESITIGEYIFTKGEDGDIAKLTPVA